MHQARYRVVEPIGCGGMATVDLAVQSGAAGFSRKVALKRMLPHLAGRSEFVDRFIREAKLGSSLSHPNIAAIYDFGQSDGTYFIAMEHVEGCSAQQLRRASATAGRYLPVEIILGLLAQLCDALVHIHERGLIHRDVSHANLLIARTGHLNLIDFGVATTRTAIAADRGKLIGKLSYMAPEQLRGGAIDHRVDLFAAGICAWELLTLRPLFRSSDDPTTIDRVLRKQVPLPSTYREDVFPDIDALVLRALERDPESRFSSAAEMRAAIDAVAARLRLDISPAAIARWLERAPAQLGDLDLIPGSTVPEDPTEVDVDVTVNWSPTRESVTPEAWPVNAPDALAPRPRRRPSSALLIVTAVVGLAWLSREGFEAMGREPEVVAEPIPAAAPAAETAPETAAAPAAETEAETETQDGAADAVADAAAARRERRRRRRERRERREREATPAEVLGELEAPVRAPQPPALHVALPEPPAPRAPKARPRAESGPKLVPPSAVAKRSGAIPELALRRSELRGLERVRVAARFCVDRRGSVTSLALLGELPRRARRQLDRALRRWRFRPYREDGRARPACFARQLSFSIDAD